MSVPVRRVRANVEKPRDPIQPVADTLEGFAKRKTREGDSGAN